MVSPQQIIDTLVPFLTPKRLERMQSVLSQRTRYISVVLEDIYQSHNASAVLRSCDAFGIQDVHIIEKRNEYKINPEIALGSAQWLTLHRHHREAADSRLVLNQLRQQGYRLVATSPHAQGYKLHELPISNGPIALLFGTELTGLSPEALEMADEFVAIPMYGFVESFNISVSVAICLAQLVQTMRASAVSWQLTESEAQEIQAAWLTHSVKNAGKILERSTQANQAG